MGSVGADRCVGPETVLHGAGRRSGTNGDRCENGPCQRGGTEPAPLQKNGSKLAHGGVRLGCGFRQPNSETEFGASVMVTPPYGSNAGGAQQRADVVGIGPYAPRGDERAARRGRRALRVVAESRRDCPGERRTAERLRQRGRGMGGNRGRDYPKSVQQPRTIPQSACG